MPKIVSDLRLCLQAPTSQNSHTQTMRRQQPTNFLSVFDKFVGLALKGLREKVKM